MPAWATEHDLPINVGYQIVNSAGRPIPLWRTPAPGSPCRWEPGKSLTFTLGAGLDDLPPPAGPAALQITLVQESVAWWEASDRWSPAVVPLPRELISPSAGLAAEPIGEAEAALHPATTGLRSMPEPLDLHLDHVARLQIDRRLPRDADTGRGAGEDQVARFQREHLGQVRQHGA